MERTVPYEGKYIRVVKEGNWEYVERTNGNEVVYIVPILKTDRKYVIFIKEYRIPLKAYVVGFPAGLVGDTVEETIETAAQRELIEETGYKAERMRYLTKGPSSSGLSPENVHFYLADRLTQLTLGGGDETENISVHKVPLEEANNWLESEMKKGSVLDVKAYLGLYFAEKMSIE